VHGENLPSFIPCFVTGITSAQEADLIIVIIICFLPTSR